MASSSGAHCSICSSCCLQRRDHPYDQGYALPEVDEVGDQIQDLMIH